MSRALLMLPTAAILLIAVIAPLSNQFRSANADSSQSDLKLVVQPMAPTLPADGGTYFMILQLQTVNDNLPIEAMKDTVINLTASDSGILHIPAQVTLKQGQTYTKVYLNTTRNIGNVTISALTSHTTPGFTTIATSPTSTLQPSKLVIYGAPSLSVPDPRFIGKVYIQLLNAQGLPARALSPVMVTLSSSDPQIVQVPPYAYINAGNSGTVVNFVPGYQSGAVQLSATSPGLAPAVTQIATSGLVATQIFVDFGPKIIPAQTGASANVIVQLRDPNGFPVKAYQTTRISLKSSITSVASLPDYVDILPGQSYAIGTMSSGGTAGSSQITASAPGLQSGLVTVGTVASTSASPKNLYVFAVPDVLPPDSTQSPSIYYVYTDGNANVNYNLTGVVGSPVPSYFPGNIGATITSSNLQVGDLAGGFVTQPFYGMTSFKTTFKAGSSSITVSQNGIRSWMTQVSTKGPQPAALTVTQVPSVIQADGLSYQAVMVGLLDSSANPVPASQDTMVFLTSSSPTIMNPDSSIVIPAGQSYAIASMTTSMNPGQATISASSSGLKTASTIFTTTAFTSPYTLGMYAVPNIMPSDGIPHGSIVLQLHDVSGNPIAAPASIPIALSSSSLTAGNVDGTVIIPAGSTYAIANFTANTIPISSQQSPPKMQSVQVTASAQGFQSITTSISIGSQHLQVGLTNAGSFGFTKTPVGVNVFTNGFPLSGATVTVSGIHADLVKVLTDQTGHANAVFSPNQPGDNTVDISVTKPGYIPFVQSTSINIKQAIDLKVYTATQHGRQLSTSIAVLPPVGQVITKKTDVNTPVEIKNGDFGKYTLTAPNQFEDPSGKYKFVAWSDGIMDNPRSTNIYVDTNLTAIYSASYYLDITTPQGTAAGSGYYQEGTAATISVSPAVVQGIISDKSFVGWSGDIQADTTSATVLMDGPKSVVATWHDNYLKAIIIGAVGGSGAGVFIYLKKIKPMRKQKAQEEEDAAPGLDWFKP